MASGVAACGNLLASYNQATDPQASKYDADVAKVRLVADIYYFLAASDTKTRLAAESILRNQHLPIPQKLATLRVIEGSAPDIFLPELHELLRINAKRIREQKKHAEARQKELRHKAALFEYQISGALRPFPSDAARAHTDGREEKRGPGTASAPRPSTAPPAKPRRVEHPQLAPEAVPMPLSNASPDITSDLDSMIHLFASLIFAGMVAYRASE